jgi:hypothetical protein
LPIKFLRKPLPGQNRIKLGDAHRVNKEHRAQFLRLLPNGMKLGIGERSARDRSADGGAAQTLFPDRSFEFFPGELRVLQSQRRERREPLAVAGDEFRKLLVLRPHDFGGEIAVATIPIGIDRQDLHVDRLRIHRLEARVEVDVEVLPAAAAHADPVRVVPEQRGCFMEQAVRVDVDRLDLFAVDSHRAARRRRRLRARYRRPAAAAKRNAFAAAPRRNWRRVLRGTVCCMEASGGRNNRSDLITADFSCQ